MKLTKELFGRTECGKDVYLYTLENSRGLQAQVMNYGAMIVRLYVPDKNGETADVALGYDRLEQYFENGCFFGAVIGPNANRIGDAAFTLDGVTYKLDANDGKNNLHSHKTLGSHKRVWDTKENEDGVTFTLSMADGELGFPGNKVMKVTYSVTEDNELVLSYEGISDKNTILNLTNHCYFNLDGAGNGTIEGHRMQILAQNFTPADSGSIPDGEIVPVEGTPMDFREMHVIGDRIDADFEQLQMARGYDHNWVLDGFDGGIRLVAVTENASGSRTMETYTDLPGVQFYAGNFIEKEEGKNGKVYGKRAGLCLETQYFPDSANKAQFPSAVFGPERPYKATTVYKFK